MLTKPQTTLIVITLLLIPNLLLADTSNAQVITNKDDGIWYDNFIYTPSQNTSITLNNCDLNRIDGFISLNRSDETRTYTYQEDTNHEVYWDYFGLLQRLGSFYLILRELPLPNFLPDQRTSQEFEFNLIDKRGLYSANDGRAATRQSLGRRVIYHHFRVHMGIAPEFIDYINVTYRGSATNEQDVRLYFYKYGNDKKTFGQWALLNSDTDLTNEYMYADIIPEDITRSLNNNNYLDIYVACITENSQAELSSDYLRIRAELTDAYLTEEGSIITKDLISPASISKVETFYWEQLIWDGLSKPETQITCHLLYENDTGVTKFVEDQYLPGNTNGFTQSPINLNNLNINRFPALKIQVNLSSENPNLTPALYQLAITWQNDITKWQDQFNTDFRIDVRNRLKLYQQDNTGFLNISNIIGDWPFIGFDIQNTHATDTNGPKTNTLWWQDYIDGRPFTHNVMTPVIRDGELYLTYQYAKNIFKISDISRKASAIKEIDFNNNKKIQASPILTENHIIVATADTDSTENTIYALDRTSYNISWEFSYGKNILFTAAPIYDDNTIYITSGDPETLTSQTNKLFALNIKNNDQWNFTLPQCSESTPSIWNNYVYACCHENLLNSGRTLFAFDKKTGDRLWNKSIGDIGKASVVVSDDTLFVASKEDGKIQITALAPQNGSQKWQTSIGSITTHDADSTPALHLTSLYYIHPDGTLYTLSTEDGSIQDQKQIYSGIYPVQTSPCFADNILYIGLPAQALNAQGRLIAYDLSSKSNLWSQSCDMYGDRNNVYSSPIVTNGLVFFGDEWNNLYILGEYSRAQEDISGFLISNPIELPSGSWFDRFNAGTNTTTGVNEITFSLLDENKTKLTDLTNGNTINLGEGITNRIVRLRADFTAKNVSVNAYLFNWSISFVKDDTPPAYDADSFEPGIWTNEIVPEFSINVIDQGTGLLVSSASTKLSYKIDDTSYETTLPAECTGSNGTKSTQTILLNISNQPFYPNITALNSIEFTIYDLANNVNITKFTFKQDTTKPTSDLDNETVEEEYTTPTVTIQAAATDPGTPDQNASGIEKVTLLYRHSKSVDPDFNGDWKIFGADTNAPYEWEFTPIENGGWYELATNATDQTGNTEDPPESGKIMFQLDAAPPSIPDYSGSTWFNSVPRFSIDFEDDYLLDIVEYKPNFETTWTTIDTNILDDSYSDSWNIKTSYWDQMNEGESYLIQLRITDVLGNTQTVVGKEGALVVQKDTIKPNVFLEAAQLVSEISWEDNFMISAFADDADGSGINTVTLSYAFSEDNESYGSSQQYGDEITSSDIQWDFSADDGNGFYKFMITAVDYAGNQDTAELIVEVKSFPSTLVSVLFALLAVFLILTFVLLWWKKTHPI